MKNISLTQLSVFIVIVYLASFFVSAEQDSTKRLDYSEVAKIENSTPNKASEESSGRFTFSSLDLDQNGKLSQKEVSNGRNNWLGKSFIDIDANADMSLTEQELVDYAAKVAASSKSTS